MSSRWAIIKEERAYFTLDRMNKCFILHALTDHNQFMLCKVVTTRMVENTLPLIHLAMRDWKRLRWRADPCSVVYSMSMKKRQNFSGGLIICYIQEVCY